ncbi:MAG: LamG domain-containing protein, partial [Pedobacter sp.]
MLSADRFGLSAGAYTFNGTSQYMSTATSIPSPGPSVFSISVWFKTTTTSGGKIVGFGNAQTGTSGNYDRHIYMNNSGQLIFGVYTGSVKTIKTTTAFNDDNWHNAVAVLSANGMKFYVDG